MKWLKLTLGEWNLLLLQIVRGSSTCFDPPPSWVMLVVDKENGLHEALYVEFLPRIMQRVIFCSCESNGGFSTKFAKYDSLVYIHVVCRYTCLWKASFIAWLGYSWTSTFMSFVLGQADVTSSVFWTTTQGRVTLSVYPHQLLPCPCVVYNFFFLFKFLNFLLDCWHVVWSWSLSIMSFHPSGQMPRVSFQLVASFPMTSFIAYK